MTATFHQCNSQVIKAVHEYYNILEVQLHMIQVTGTAGPGVSVLSSNVAVLAA